MMKAFSPNEPQIRLNQMKERSQIDEQEGLKFMFAGAMLAIRNPRGHEIQVKDTPDQCLDYLSFGSLLLRQLEKAGGKINLEELGVDQL